MTTATPRTPRRAGTRCCPADPVAALLGSGRLGVVDSGLRMCTARVLASDGEGWWTTRLHIDGWQSCSCPARRYRPRQHCLHIRALARVAAPSLRAAVNNRRDRPAGEEGEA